MASKKTAQMKTGRALRPPQETPAEASRNAGLAGLKLSTDDAAKIENRFAQRRAAIETVRKLPYETHEPANTFSL